MTQRVLEQICLFGNSGNLSLNRHLAQAHNSVPDGDQGSRVGGELSVQPGQLASNPVLVHLFNDVFRSLEGVERRSIAIIAERD